MGSRVLPEKHPVHEVLERRGSTEFLVEADTQVANEGKAAVLVRK